MILRTTGYMHLNLSSCFDTVIAPGPSGGENEEKITDH